MGGATFGVHLTTGALPPVFSFLLEAVMDSNLATDELVSEIKKTEEELKSAQDRLAALRQKHEKACAIKAAIGRCFARKPTTSGRSTMYYKIMSCDPQGHTRCRTFYWSHSGESSSSIYITSPLLRELTGVSSHIYTEIAPEQFDAAMNDFISCVSKFR